jgi:hypothetical protein
VIFWRRDFGHSDYELSNSIVLASTPAVRYCFFDSGDMKFLV